MSRLLTTDQHN